MPRLPGGTVTFVVTDIEGSTRCALALLMARRDRPTGQDLFF